MQKSLKRLLLISAILLSIVAISACGSTTTAGSATTPTVAAAAPTDTPTPAPAAAAVVKTTSATVGGKSTTILTDAQGKTLYYFKPDTSSSVACTAACAQNWPPL